jgi:hypothetical protein
MVVHICLLLRHNGQNQKIKNISAPLWFNLLILFLMSLNGYKQNPAHKKSRFD